MSIAESITRTEEQIAAACFRAARSRTDVRLMAVSKTRPAEAVLEAFAAGIRLFGENRVQEYADKKQALSMAGIFAAQYSANFHCIGPVQSNKSSRAADLFDAIDTLDSLRLAERLDKAAAQANKTVPCCIEIKLSPEAAKHGLAPDAAELDELLERLPDLHHLQARGLMTVPPYAEDPEQSRPYFRRLRDLQELLAQRHPRVTLDELSMGMSHNFAVAIEEGSTMVRVGTAIFGARPSL